MISCLEQFGFDAQGARTTRLTEVGLNESEVAVGRRLQELVVGPNIEAILDRFYDHLWRQPTSRSWLESKSRIERLRRTQRAYLCSLGVDFGSPEYFDDRLRVGAAHERIGLPLPLYQATYGLMQRILLEFADSAAGDAVALRRELVNFIVQITALDLSLAVESYHRGEYGRWRRELDDLREKSEVLRAEADTDPLTGAASRRAVLSYLDALLESKRPGKIAVLVSDVDRFKVINDELGHVAGDMVLAELVRRFTAALRRNDVLGRYGGDELLAVLVDADIDAAAEVGERVRRAISARPIETNNGSVSVTVTLGVSVAVDGDTAMTLFGRADEVLFEMKRAGRNRLGTSRSESNPSG